MCTSTDMISLVTHHPKAEGGHCRIFIDIAFLCELYTNRPTEYSGDDRSSCIDFIFVDIYIFLFFPYYQWDKWLIMGRKILEQ